MPQESKVFQASFIWKLNSYGAIIGGVGGAIFLTLYFWLLARTGRASHVDVRMFYILGLSAITTLLAYFPGNLGVYWPYAVKVDPEVGVTLFGPFKAVFIPI